MICEARTPLIYVRNPLTRNFSNRSFFLMPGSNDLERSSISLCLLFFVYVLESEPVHVSCRRVFQPQMRKTLHRA